MKLMDYFRKREQAKTTDNIERDSLVMLWRTVYRGNPNWLEYEYATLNGTKRKRVRKSMRPAKLVCHELAGLIWSELPEITADDTVMEVLQRSDFYRKGQAFTERIMALGGGALKIYVKNNRPYLTYVPADRFIPVSWDNTGVYEADFLDKTIVKEKAYVRIESHRMKAGQVVIKNEAYEITDAQQKSVPLSRIGGDYAAEETINSSRPIFAYIANPEDNNLQEDTPAGISMFANAIDTIESLDIAFDALQSEIVLGRKRIIVPAAAVRSVMDTETGRPLRYFDPSDEIFQAFSTDDSDSLKISDNSVNLRVDEIRLAIQTLLDVLSIQVGFSAGYLSFDGAGGVKTATEVISENSKTFKTKKTWEAALTRGLVQIMDSIREVARVYGQPVSNDQYAVTWQDSVIEDRSSRAEYWHARYEKGTATLAEVLQALDGIPEEDAKQKAAAILRENADVDINTIFGGAE